MKKYINQQDMKQANAADVFGLIRARGQVTRKQLEQWTNLSWGAVSNITARLIQSGYIVETKPEKIEGAGAGRTPSYLAVNEAEHFCIGLDINSSGLQAVVVNLQNKIVKTLSRPADFRRKDILLSDIYKLTDAIVQTAGGHHILGIGIAMQGQVDALNGVSVSLPHCKDWVQVPLGSLVSERFGLPVLVEHDPNCILYAQSAGTKTENVILLRVDNGIGMAVMLEGSIFDRPGMFELGHICAVPNGAPCSCGKKGCLEAYASQEGMARRYGKPFDRLAAAAKNGESKAVLLFEDMAAQLAAAICNASTLLHIKNIVLCGDMWRYQDLFYDKFLHCVQAISGDNPPSFSVTDVENAAFGAALIAVERSVKHIRVGKDDNK